jgi:myo-inositol 2-dehydrogenase/D-chiro-inositol 1-dehydrogenase
MKKLKLGLIGAGRIGVLHAKNASQQIPQAELAYLTDVDAKAASACAAALGGIPVSTDHREMLEDSSVDAVVICSSTDTHAPLIIEAAEAGKHIFCEKPVDFDLGKIDRALAAVKNAGVKLQIGFNRRFDANAMRIKQAIERGEVGAPHRIHIISRDPAPPPAEYIKRSGGLFLDMMIHDFDMVRFLMGCEATEVYTMAGVRVDPVIGELGDVDTAVVMLRFENGAIGTIENSRKTTYGYDQRLEVFGSEGSIEGKNLYPNEVLLRGETLSRDQPHYFFLERYEASYRNELQSFVDAVVTDRPVPVTGVDGRMPVVMGLAARRSYDENRPVSLG